MTGRLADLAPGIDPAAELGTGPVRERYLVSGLDTADSTQWQTEICWPVREPRIAPID